MDKAISELPSFVEFDKYDLVPVTDITTNTTRKYTLENILSGVASTLPPGTIIYFAGASAPYKTLVANGAAVSRTTYSNLFSAIGTTYGVGDGFNTFNLPDLRGEFIRGADVNRGVDIGRLVGTSQPESIKAHGHTLDISTSSDVEATGGNARILTNNTTPSTTVTSSYIVVNDNIGNETRPRNIALLPCIVY